MMASLLLHWKSNNVCPFPQKLLISHWLPVLSGSNPEMAHVSTQGVPGPPTPKKKNNQKEKNLPATTPPPKKKKKKRKKKKGQERKKKKKRGSYLCESSLGGLACWRAFIGKRLVRRGLQQQYLWNFRI